MNRTILTLIGLIALQSSVAEGNVTIARNAVASFEPIELNLADGVVAVQLKVTAKDPPDRFWYSIHKSPNLTVLSDQEWTDSISNTDTARYIIRLLPPKSDTSKIAVFIFSSKGYGYTRAVAELFSDEKSVRIPKYAGSNKQYKTEEKQDSSILLPPPKSPFGPSSEVRFELSIESKVTVEIFSVAGKRVWALFDTLYSAGIHPVVWDAKDRNGEPLKSGIYFYKVTAGEESFIEKFVLLK